LVRYYFVTFFTPNSRLLAALLLLLFVLLQCTQNCYFLQLCCCICMIRHCLRISSIKRSAALWPRLLVIAFCSTRMSRLLLYPRFNHSRASHSSMYCLLLTQWALLGISLFRQLLSQSLCKQQLSIRAR